MIIAYYTVKIFSISSVLKSPVLKPYCYFNYNYSMMNFLTSSGYSYAIAVVRSSNNSTIRCYLKYKSDFSIRKFIINIYMFVLIASFIICTHGVITNYTYTN